MGITLQDAKELLQLKSANHAFAKVLSLGRQQLYFNPWQLEDTLREASYPKSAIESFMTSTANEGPAEPLFKLLGAVQMDSLDYSDYEGATIVHDMNRPVAENLHGRYDLVFDGGTLEHIFNFPTSIRNAMEMVKEGGLLVLATPGNNQMGHGFYQFSPELFFNVLSENNGFCVEKMIAIEISPAHRKFLVADPFKVKERVTLSNSWPVELFVVARRTSRLPLFRKFPQQSDYQSKWKEGEREVSASAMRRGKDRGAVQTLKNLSRKFGAGPVRFITSFKAVFLEKDREFRKPKHFHEL